LTCLDNDCVLQINGDRIPSAETSVTVLPAAPVSLLTFNCPTTGVAGAFTTCNASASDQWGNFAITSSMLPKLMFSWIPLAGKVDPSLVLQTSLRLLTVGFNATVAGTFQIAMEWLNAGTLYTSPSAIVTIGPAAVEPLTSYINASQSTTALAGAAMLWTLTMCDRFHNRIPDTDVALPSFGFQGPGLFSIARVVASPFTVELEFNRVNNELALADAH